MNRYNENNIKKDIVVHIPSILGEDKNIDNWRKFRRLEILRHFENEVYGTMPKDGYNISFAIEDIEEVLDGLAEKRLVSASININNNKYRFDFVLLIPKHRQDKVPVNIMIYGNENKAAPPWAANIDINQDYINPYWPAKLLIECGMASAIFRTSDIESDNRDAFPSGLVKFFNTNMNEKYTAGCISAWGFSVSRIIDYLVKCEEIDSRYISVTGHSRGGKTALWCAAMDERITCAFANNPGCGGASMGKLTKGEKIHQITEAFPHWFSDNYKKYSGQEETMDFDQHMLLGLVAPRLLYITSGSEDYWNDPDSEFAGCYYTNEIYNAYGLPGLVSDSNKRPEIRKPLHDGKVGYHIRAGGHDLSLFDWMLFLNFLKKHS